MTDSNELKVEVLLDIINSSAREAMKEYKKNGHGVPGADSTTFHPLDLATDTLVLRKAIRLLEGACHQLSAVLAPPQHTVFNFVHNYTWACTDVAIRARIADVLDQYPEGLNVYALADAVNLDKTKTLRVLRALVLKGCFKEVEHEVFANTRLSLLLKSTSNVGCMVRGYQDFPKYGINRDFWEMDIFHRGLLGYPEIVGSSAVLHHYPWDTVSSIVDVGSGIGGISLHLANMFPHLRITNQDLPEVIEQAQVTWAKDAPEAVRDGRVEFVPLNFLEESPVIGKDVYYLRSILHDWPDAEAMTILHNIRKVMGPNSQHKAPEPMLLNFGAGAHTAYHQDMVVWFLLNSKERTLNELKIIGATAGLVITGVYDLVGTMVVEFRIAQD
ncbi:S-adenosyl-L-methionine-dependent methyltransferase [Suillus cothurnatus]|nr:S-adenosyl-L-methionine-dependent methyltransferase [Suillus cothurnatus]